MLTIINSAYAMNRLAQALDEVRRLTPRETALALVRRMMDAVIGWQERAHERRRLIDMEDRLLADIGLGRAEAQAEFDKPFWRT